VDGKKRAAVTVTAAFLKVNGYRGRLTAAIQESPCFRRRWNSGQEMVTSRALSLSLTPNR
jgi:prophage maintenance system killer protein